MIKKMLFSLKYKYIFLIKVFRVFFLEKHAIKFFFEKDISNKVLFNIHSEVSLQSSSLQEKKFIA